MYCYENIEISPTSLSFTTKKDRVLDFVKRVEKGDVSITACKHFFSRSEEDLLLKLSDHKTESIHLSIEELPQENLDAFYEAANKKNAVIKLTSEERENGIIKLTFTIDN